MFPFLVGLSVLIAGGGADLIAENYGPLDPDKLYAGSLGAAFFLIAGPFLHAYAVLRAGPRAAMDLWRAVQFAAVMLGLATWIQLHPVFAWSNYLSGVSSRWEQLEPEHIIVPLGAFVAAFVVRRREVPSPLPLRAAISMLVALVVLVGAEVRLRRAAPPWALLDHLPFVMNLPPVPGAGASSTTRLGDNLWIRRFWNPVDPGYCDASIARSEAEFATSIPPEHRGLAVCEALTLRSLPVSHEYALVGPPEADRNAWVIDGTSLARLHNGRARIGDYPERVAPPKGWVRISWGLLGLSVLALFGRRGSTRWLDARDRWRSATLDREGLLRFEDGSSASLSYWADLAPGPVVVLAPEARSEGGPFRAMPAGLSLTPGDVRAGTPATVRAELESTRGTVWVRLTATAWLATAPLVPFVLRQMVF